MPRLLSCPDPVVLEKLLDDSLNPRDRSRVERHVQGCDDCLGRLESLAYDGDGEPRSIGCPERGVLRRYHEGTLGDFAWETIEHHLERCKACQELLERVYAGENPGTMATQCPDRAALRAFLEGSLPVPDQPAIEKHVDDCDRCQARLESLFRLRSDEPMQIRDLGDHGVESPRLGRVIETLKDEFRAEPVSSQGLPSVDQAEVLHFLDPSETPGDLGRFGPYRVLAVLGQGGMGLVLKAFDPALNRPIAIKVLAPQLATSGPARQRFLREARASAAIRDEHVVAIHAVDEWKGLPYLVMELIPGVSLQERIDHAAPLDVGSILRIAMQAARGLAAAHAQGLVHRDIKPSNILLENGVERVKLTDFGLARAVDDASLTRSGIVAGTPLYMAPEQARGETLDHRADLFSLGAVMYAMGTGRPPFRASTTLGVLRRVCDDEHRPIEEVNYEIPGWLAEIIDRLLAKDRRDRFQTAGEVAQILGDRLARRQRGPSVVTASHRLPRPQAATFEDVGPLKDRWSGRDRWVGTLLAIATIMVLLGIIALRYASASEWLSALPWIHSPDSKLSVQRDDPRLRILVDGIEPDMSRDHRNSIVFARLKPGRHHVEGYAGSRKTEGYEVEVRPGGSLVLRFKGTVLPGEDRVPTASRPEPPGVNPFAPAGDVPRDEFAWGRLQLCEEHLSWATDREERQRERVVLAEKMLERGFGKAQSVAHEKRWLEAMERETQEAKNALTQAERALANLPRNDGLSLQEEKEIASQIKADPEVMKVAFMIHRVREGLVSLQRLDAGPDDPRVAATLDRLQESTAQYQALWEIRSEQLRKSFIEEKSRVMP